MKGFKNNKDEFIPTEPPKKFGSNQINSSTDVDMPNMGFAQRGDNAKKLTVESPKEIPVSEVISKESTMIHGEPVVGKIRNFDYEGRSQAITLKIELRQKDHPQKGVDGKDYQNPLELGISGSIWNANHSDITTGGQIQDTLREEFDKGNIKVAGLSDAEFEKLLDVWDRWHLNDLNAGTEKQMRLIKEHEHESKYQNLDISLDRPQAILKDHNAEPDDGYSYGSAWLYEPLPEDVISFVKSIQNKL